MIVASTSEPNVTAIDPENYTWHVYVRVGVAPTTIEYDFNFTLPLPEDVRIEMVQGKIMAYICKNG